MAPRRCDQGGGQDRPHRQGVAELRAIGRDIERNVLARAVNWHVQNRVIVAGNKTVVFN